MSLKLIIITIPVVLLLIVSCSDDSTQSTNTTDDIQPTKIKAYDNSIAVKMPHVSNDTDLPTDSLEVK